MMDLTGGKGRTARREKSLPSSRDGYMTLKHNGRTFTGCDAVNMVHDHLRRRGLMSRRQLFRRTCTDEKSG
jgi:hypothetical protein